MQIRITSIILIVVIILSVIYVFYGKNWFAEQQFIQKQRSSEFVRNELMEKFLEIQEQSQELLNDILKETYDLNLLPGQKITLKKEWSRELDFELSLKPVFDHKQMYLISENTLKSISKKPSILKWERVFEEGIIGIELLDANRLLVVIEGNKMFCLHRDLGTDIWERNLNCNPHIDYEFNSIFQISLDKYRRLDSSIILLLSDNSITALNNITGESLATYVSKNKIHFVSDFDLIEKCIYIYEDNCLVKIDFIVKS